MFVENKMTMYTFGTQRVLPVLLPGPLRHRVMQKSLVTDDATVFGDDTSSSIRGLVSGLSGIDVGLLYIGDKDVGSGRSDESRRVAHAILDIANWIVYGGICRMVIVFVRSPRGSHRLSNLARNVMELCCTRDISTAVIVKAIPPRWSRHDCFDSFSRLTAAGRSAAAVVTARALGFLPHRQRTRPVSPKATTNPPRDVPCPPFYEDRNPDVKKRQSIESEPFGGPAKRIKREV